MKTKRLLPIFLLLLGLSSCGIFSKTGGTAGAYRNYSEDLSQHRVDFDAMMEEEAVEAGEGERTVLPASAEAIDEDLSSLLRKHYSENRRTPYFSGFTILLYSGMDRDEAFSTRNRIYEILPDAQIDMQYEQPRYLVKVGRYVSRIEAQAQFQKLRKKFPSARVIQDRFLRPEYNIQDKDLRNAESQDQGVSESS